MTHGLTRQQILQRERRVLQALCQGTPQGSPCEAGGRILKTYRWREPLHEIVFQVLMAIPSHAPDLIREQIPARLTRKGFPDVPWEDFFKPHSLSLEDAERLMRELLDSESSV